jgi:hypothetical protein
MHGVDLTPIYSTLNEVAGLILSGLALFVAGWIRWAFHKYLTPYLGEQAETKAANDLNTALQNGVAIALTQAQAWESAHKDVKVQGSIAAWAAQYAVNHAPDAVKRFGYDPDELAIKALAYLPPPPPLPADGTGAAAHINPITVENLPPPPAPASATRR